MNRISELKLRLREETLKLFGNEAVMLTAPDQAEHMKFLLKLAGAKKGLEIGVFTGYSALSMAEALPEDGRIIAIDVSKEWTDLAQKYWAEAGVAHKIHLRLEGGIAVLDEMLADPAQLGTFDFAFIDADKVNYPNYYDRVLKLLRSGGILMIDNTLWNGHVANQEKRENDPSTKAIARIVEMALADDRVETHSIRLSDGVTFVQKK